MGDVEVITGTGTDLISAPSWDAFAGSAGTPFHTRRFLLSWWQDRAAKNPASRLAAATVVDGEQVVGVCALELDGDGVSFAGGHDVVDYMGPLAAPGREQEVVAALAEWIFDRHAWSRARFAGLVRDEPVTRAFAAEVARRVPGAAVETYDQAPRIEPAPGGYLSLLNSKRRADVLRKRNRLAEAVGELELVDSTRDTAAPSLERLLAWKAAASRETSAFVDAYGGFMRTLIAALSEADAAHVVELRASGTPLAAAIVLRQGETDYIYNMAYDTAFAAGEHAGLAPGVVLVSRLVERSLGRGARFDFLKGAQDYKLRLGGVPVDLVGLAFER